MRSIKPTVMQGTNDMRVFQEEIFGPVTAATTFKTVEEAIEIANNVEFGKANVIMTCRDLYFYHCNPLIWLSTP